MIEAAIPSWEDAKSLILREIEKRMSGNVEDCWVDSIRLEQHMDGDIWIVRLKTILKKGFSKKGYLVSAKVDSISGKIKEFEIKPAR
ncbi:MAG: hypothetical protein DRN49_00465 [Thaumarchaeota archaeon]|nr:MAG: hypothetical protein DRN49_00465 [Nitrososphaerota archaeon]